MSDELAFADEWRREVYIGDALYVSFDGYHVWLRTGDGNNNRIALEPDVIVRLMTYLDDLKAKIAAYHAGTESE